MCCVEVSQLGRNTFECLSQPHDGAIDSKSQALLLPTPHASIKLLSTSPYTFAIKKDILHHRQAPLVVYICEGKKHVNVLTLCR